jgi:hypothetical protein
MSYPKRVVGVLVCVSAVTGLSCARDPGDDSKGPGGKGDGTDSPDGGIHVDAAFCAAAATYPPPPAGKSTNYAAAGSGSAATPHEITYTARLDDGSPNDVLFVDLYAGYGVFADTDIHAGTFTITGDDRTFSTCGACVLLAADTTSAAVGDWYMANGGTLTLTSVDINQVGSDGSAHFRGTLSNATFRHVTKSSNGGPGDVTIADCTSAVPSATLDANMAVGSAVSGAPSARLQPEVEGVLHRRWR